MFRLSFFLSLFYGLFFLGNSQQSSDTVCRTNYPVDQISQEDSSGSAWSFLGLLASEEIELEEENEEQESIRILIGGKRSGIINAPSLPNTLQPYLTTTQTFSTQKKTALFVLFGQFLI